MDKFFETLEQIIVKVWNELYRYLCETMGAEVNEDWIITDLEIED